MRLRLVTLCENTSTGIGIAAEWGLSILIEYAGKTVLLDTGGSNTLVRNAALMGVELQQIDKIVISHGHVDHTGGLRSLLGTMRKKVEITGHPDLWGSKYAARWVNSGAGVWYDYIGIPFQREELENRGALFNLKREPVRLNEFMMTTGEVPMVTPFEKVDQNMFLKDGNDFIPDPMNDDQAVIIKTSQGLVIVLGCAHRGMVNTMIHARNITGVDQIHAVVGGTHLIRAGEEQLKETIDQIKQFRVEKLGVSHCTGLKAAAVLAQEFGDKFFFNNAGTVVSL